MLIKFLQNSKFKKYILDPTYNLSIIKDRDSLLDGKSYIWESNGYDIYATRAYVPRAPSFPIFRNRLKINI